MTFVQELSSWNPFTWVSNVEEVPEIGSTAPTTSQLQLPRADGKPVILSFLRHCGCPFAEKIFLKTREAAKTHPDIHFISISHSDERATKNWLEAVGGSGSVEVLVDDGREIFAKYGLGMSSMWAVLKPASLSATIKAGKEEGFQVRPTESGSRWQSAGLYAVDPKGVIKYSHPAKTSDDLGDVEEAIESVKSG